MYRGQEDLVWVVPLFLAGIFFLGTAGLWWRIAYGKNVGGVDLKPTTEDFREAASMTAACFALLGAAILLAFWVRG
ncbi:MAG: hypothetical protein M3Q19_14575 [Pseudomonadota bacterium]|nr:hypothetical protein [Pseudomonadota bacterium]